MTTNFFDFGNTSDLPAKLREQLETQTTDNARQVAEIVKAGAAAGYKALNIRQIEAVMFRKAKAEAAEGAEVSIPTTATVRAYLNAAVKLGLIGKPTRNSYGADASVVVEGDDEDEADAAPAPAVAEDPLSGL